MTDLVDFFRIFHFEMKNENQIMLADPSNDKTFDELIHKSKLLQSQALENIRVIDSLIISF